MTGSAGGGASSGKVIVTVTAGQAPGLVILGRRADPLDYRRGKGCESVRRRHLNATAPKPPSLAVGRARVAVMVVQRRFW